jgi:hypothetical protein
MAGTTGLEPAASAVTENLADVTYRNQTVSADVVWFWKVQYGTSYRPLNVPGFGRQHEHAAAPLLCTATIHWKYRKPPRSPLVIGIRPSDNIKDVRVGRESITLDDLSKHDQQREAVDRNIRISYSRKRIHVGYLKKWIEPRWGSCALFDIRAV